MPKPYFGRFYYCDICKKQWQCSKVGVSFLNARKGHHRSRQHQDAQRARELGVSSSCNEMSQEEKEEEMDFDVVDEEDGDEGGESNPFEEWGLLRDGYDSGGGFDMDREEEDDKENEADDEEEMEDMEEDMDDDDVDVDCARTRSDVDEEADVGAPRSTSRIRRSLLESNRLLEVQRILLDKFFDRIPAKFNKVEGNKVDLELAMDILDHMESFHMSQTEGDAFITFMKDFLEKVRAKYCNEGEVEEGNNFGLPSCFKTFRRAFFEKTETLLPLGKCEMPILPDYFHSIRIISW
jgi:hypothetical protein